MALIHQGRRLHLPRLRQAARMVPAAPHRLLGRGWHHRSGQPHKLAIHPLYAVHSLSRGRICEHEAARWHTSFLRT